MAPGSSPQKKKKPARPATAETSGKKKDVKYDVHFFHSWCKQCGLCMAFCPRKIIKADKNGHPEIIDSDRCTGCRFCEIHCPDFSISVEVRLPKRRKTDA